MDELKQLAERVATEQLLECLSNWRIVPKRDKILGDRLPVGPLSAISAVYGLHRRTLNVTLQALPNVCRQ